MKKVRCNSIISVILLSIELCLILAVIVLENLSARKMGVMRSLVYRNKVLKEGFFSTEMLNIYLLVLIFCMGTILAVSLIKLFKNKSSLRLKKLSLLITLIIAGIIFLSSSRIREFSAYYFFLIAIFINILLEFLRLIFLGFANKKPQE